MEKTDDSEIVASGVEEHVQIDAHSDHWYKQPGLRKLYLMMPILFLSATTNGYDGSLLNGLQTMPQWQKYFDNPSGARLGLFTTIMNVGGATSILIAPFLADWVGRRWTIASGVVVLVIGAIIQVVPGVNQEMFIGGRFLVGFGSNWVQTAAPLLITELAHPRHRGPLTTMYLTLWYVGSILAAWVVYGTLELEGNASWEIPVALQAAMPAILGFGVWLLPESPRWLLSKDRMDDARNVMVKYHASGDETNELVRFELLEIQETLRMEKESSNQGWTVLLKTPGNRKRVAIIILVGFFSQCSGNGLVNYYIHDILNSVGITGSKDQALVNGGLQIWSFLVCIAFSVVLVDRLGRKKLFMIAGVGMLISFTIWTACSAEYEKSGASGAGAAVIAMIFCFYLAAGFAWPGLTVAYSAEIMPFSIRAKGVALSFTTQSLASVVNQQVNPSGLEQLAWKFYFVYIVILVIECFTIWFYFVETKGPTLEEIARLFDGDDANVADERHLHAVMSAAMKADKGMPADEHVEVK